MKNTYNLELVPAGYANGISAQLAAKQAENGDQARLTDSEKEEIIAEAAQHFGHFLSALGCDWQNDPNSSDTPRRVAKAYVHDLWKGRFEPLAEVTSFPSGGYDGQVFEGNIPITSMCSHHHQAILGRAHVAYLPQSTGKVIGLSKLNRIVEQCSRRGTIQEQMTIAIHHAVSQVCEKNAGVAVMVEAEHHCVSCRGVKHTGASMKTTQFSDAYLTENSIHRTEFYKFCRI